MKKSQSNVNLEDLNTRMIEFANSLEEAIGAELIITSGYRSPDHPIEAKKKSPGEHTTGLAIDVVAVGGTPVYEIVEAAINLGCKRIGISRKSNFVHLGLDLTRVTSIWTY